jgi:arylformamidase
MERLIDITPRVTERTGVWPGDTPFSRRMLCEIAKGANIDLSTITTTVHLGAHADGPNHYASAKEGAVGIGEMPLEHYLGPCQVIDAPVGKVGAGAERRVRVEDVIGGVGQVRTPRVLIRTGTFNGFDDWNADFAGLTPELVDALADRGVITIGIDTPSVDVQDSKDLPAHRAIFRRSIAILEGLDLSQAPPLPAKSGREYELIALPLRFMGCDASPVRAVLRAQ